MRQLYELNERRNERIEKENEAHAKAQGATGPNAGTITGDEFLMRSRLAGVPVTVIKGK